MEEPLLRSLLFDFFGELLTEKQREYYDLHYNSDLSLFEIAEMNGITRRAVWDIIRRAEQTLRGYEEKTGLIARFLAQRRRLTELGETVRRLPDSPERQKVLEAISLLSEL